LQVLGAAIAVASAVLAALESRLHDLIEPVDARGVPLMELDSLLERTIAYVLRPIIRNAAKSADVLSPADSQLIRDAYNYNVEQIQVARSASQEYSRAGRNLRRFLTGALIAGTVAGVIIAVHPSEDPLWLGLWIVIVIIGASASIASYAYLLMRRAREQYVGATTGLRERLSGQAISEVQTGPQAQAEGAG
jgi:hypothetical protein